MIEKSWTLDANRFFDPDPAQRRAARARHRGDQNEFYHWAKVAAEVARITPHAEMNIDVVRRIADEEESRRV